MQSKLEKSISFSEMHVFPRKYRNVQNLPHWHGEPELIFTESGSAAVTVDGKCYFLQAGEAAFVCSESLHSIKSENGSIITVLKLDAAYFDRLLRGKRPVSPVLQGVEGIGSALAELLTEAKRQDAYSGVIADSVATRLLAHILRSQPLITGESASPTAEKYKRLLDEIAAKYADITFHDAAELMHFSRPYFSKYFYTHAGMSFTQYLNTIRISVAVEQLQTGNLSVTQVSQSCGFNTIRNFNRVFKALTGYAPHALPEGYRFIHRPRPYTASSFDPTLACTEVLS